LYGGESHKEETVNRDHLILIAALFIPAFLGHLIGDYLLQPRWMALTKWLPGMKGAMACTLHAAVYGIAVCAMLRTANPLIWLAVAAPHWIIDRWSLGYAWLRFIRGRTIETAESTIDTAFLALVYAVVDNTFHLLCLWGTIILALPQLSS
jgi:hypothetical protein